METESNLKSILYMTVNTVNHKIYIGVHITETPYEFDNYWGDGITGTNSYWFKHPKYPFQRACKKYGLDAFRRYTLQVFDDYEEALKAEKEIVNEEFINRVDTYNVALGGGSGLITSTEKEVFQYNINGEFIKAYRSRSDAARKNNVNVMTIIHAIQCKSFSVNSYWSETKKARINIDEFTKPQNKKVYSYNLKGEFVKEYESISQAAKDLDVTNSTIQKALIYQTLCRKYYFSYIKIEMFIKNSKKRIRHTHIYRYSLLGEFIDKLSWD